MKNLFEFTNSFAFTLAEVLITLGIIGVVAALTIPGLIEKYQGARDAAVLKETYSILQQMLRSANDDGATGNLIYTDNNNQLREWFSEYCLPYIKTSNVCLSGGDKCWTKVKYLNGSSYRTDAHCGNGDVSFTLTNGAYVCMDDFRDFRFGVKAKDNNTMIGFLIDVNGAGSPNVIGKDIFGIVFRDGELLPAGYDTTKSQLDSNCKKGADGRYCMQKVLQSGYELPVVK